MFRNLKKDMKDALGVVKPSDLYQVKVPTDFDQDEVMGKLKNDIAKHMGVPSNMFKTTVDTFDDEKWIWVEGYKGTDKDMKCRDFQYEIGKEYTEKGKIEECKNGFHLCLELSDVFRYYDINEKSRYFKVKALVCKEDVDRYGETTMFFEKRDKLVAKSIIFVSEVETKELYDAVRNRVNPLKDAPDKYIEMYCKGQEDLAIREYRKDTLINDGYSEAFAIYVVSDLDTDEFKRAHALASLDGLSMDVKVTMIFK